MRSSQTLCLLLLCLVVAGVAIAFGLGTFDSNAANAAGGGALVGSGGENLRRSDWLQAAEAAISQGPGAPSEARGTQTLRTADGGAGVVVGLDGQPVPGATLVLYAREKAVTNPIEEEAFAVVPTNMEAVSPWRESAGQVVLNELVRMRVKMSKYDGFQVDNAQSFTIHPNGEVVNSEAVIYTPPWQLLRTWRADSEGYFALDELPAEGELLLDAHNGTYALEAPLERGAFEGVAPGALRLQLVAGAILTGNVRDQVALPLEGVAVILAAAPGSDGLLDPVGEREATTNAEGRYRIVGMRSGANFQPRFTLEHHFSAQDPENVEIDGEKQLDHVLTANAVVAGVVRLGGVPHPDVELDLRGFGLAKTDAEGRFQFRPRIEGNQDLELFARTADLASLGYIKFRLVAAERREDLVLDLEAACIVRGRAVDETGRAIKGAQVSLHWEPQSARRDFDVEIANGTFVGSVIPHLRNRLKLLDARVTYTKSVRNIFQLSAPIVRTQSGGSWESIEVPAQPSSPGFNFVLEPGSFFTDAFETVSESPDQFFEEYRSTTTDAEGRFEFRGVWAGRYGLNASHEEHLAGEAIEFQLAAGAEHDADLLLPRGANVAGTVFLPDGKPAAHGTLIAVRDGDEIGRQDTDEHGRFRFVGLTPGALDLVANDNDSGAVSALRGLSLSNGTDIKDLNLRLGVGASLFGRVLDDMGGAIQSADVSLSSLLSSSTQSQATAGEDGSYRIERLLQGEHRITVSAAGYLPLEIDSISIDGALRRDFLLQRGAMLSGVVIAPDGSPMNEAQVFLFHGEQRSQEHMQTGADGRYHFEGLAPGMCELYVRADDYSCSVRASRELAIGAVIDELPLRMKPSGVVRGRVVDGEGRGVPNVQVMGHTEPGGKGERRSQSGADGRFELPRLYPDQYRIFVTGAPEKGIVIDAREGGDLGTIELPFAPR